MLTGVRTTISDKTKGEPAKNSLNGLENDAAPGHHNDNDSTATLRRAYQNPLSLTTRDIVSLQHRIGNHVVSQALTSRRLTSAGPSGRSIQRMAVTAAQLGQVNSDGTGRLFDSNLTSGKVFSKTVSVASNDAMTVIRAYINEIRPVGNFAANFRYTDEAIAIPGALPAVWPGGAAAFLAGLPAAMGLSPTGVAFVQGKSKEQATSWLTAIVDQPELRVNSDRFARIDPFLVKLTFQSALHRGKDWEITTQFSHSATGYIVKVKNGEKDITGEIVTAGEFANVSNNAAANKNQYVYSSTHVQNPDSFKNTANTLGGHEEGNSRGEYHEGLDALTWMAAEGARFQPVAKLGNRAKPQTHFYLKPNRHNWQGARSVDLVWLMSNWGLHFQRAYDIPTATIAGVVAAQGNPINGAPPGLRYNLTADKVEE